MPEWPLARAIAWAGRAPATVGRWLDRMANDGPPPLSWLIQLLSSVWLGMLWLVLVGAYIAIGSGFASLRAWLEMTDLQFFDAWPMVVLLVLLVGTIVVVTLRRIPLTLYKLGVWVVHTGIVVLIVGCFMYFGGKFEGSTRVFLGKTVRDFYDATQRALYVQRMDEKDPSKPAGPQIMVPVKGLPIYYERLAVNPDGTPGQPLDIAIPPEALAADPKLTGMALRITGYWPYAVTDTAWSEGSATAPENPAIQVALRVAGQGVDRWLLARKPSERVVDLPGAPFGIEYLRHPSAQQLADVTAKFTGPMAITVRVPKAGVTRTYPVEMGKPIAVAGTPYTLTPTGTMEMPMRSPGYEGLTPAILMLNVVRQDGDQQFKFQRQAIFRFPERSPDFIEEHGKPKRVQDRVDNDLQVSFHDATRTQAWVVEDETGKLTLIQRPASGGEVTQEPVELGRRMTLNIGRTEVGLAVLAQTDHAVLTPRVVAVPPAQRQQNLTAARLLLMAITEVDVGGKQRVAVPFIPFANTARAPDDREPALVHVPGVGPVRLLMSTVRRPLPSAVTLERFDLVKYPGARQFVADYISTLKVTDRATGQSAIKTTQLNAPAEDHGLYLFQAEWDGDEAAPPQRRYSVLGVGNRPGVRVMTTGAAMMALGILYAFYVKPVLKRKRKAQLAALAAGGRPE